MENDEVDSTVSDLLSQLKSTNAVAKKIERAPEEFNLNKEELERFVINHAGRLVKHSVEITESVKDYIANVPDSRDVEALAGLITATSSALETLNKIVIADKKVDATIKVKQMDIEGKKEQLKGVIGGALMLTREEVLKKLIEHSQIIDIESAKLENKEIS